MRTVAEILRQGMAFHQAGDFERAAHCYTEILAREPARFEALSHLGLLEAQRGRYEQALHLLEQALKIDPHSIPAKVSYGNVLQALDRHAQALAIWDEILEIDPASPLAHYNRGNVLRELKRDAEALQEYDRVLTLMPDNAPALYNRGCVLQQFNRHAEALACYDRLLALIPGNVDALHNRGAALHKLRRYEEALASYDLALSAAPDDAEVLTNRGAALYELRRYQDALASYDRALAIMPGFAEAWSNRADVLLDLNQPAAALADWDKALAIKPDFAEALNNRGPALHQLGRLTEAIASYARALELDPDYQYVYGNWLHERTRICDWNGVDEQFAQLAEKIYCDKKVSSPFFTLPLSDSLSLQRRAAEIWVNDKYPASPVLGEHPGHRKHDKISIGYFSADFRDHPVSLLTTKLFETHDRSRFELTAFSFGPDTKDAVRARLEPAFDKFIDVRMKSDKEVATLARRMEIDIAVDLGGYTEGGRPGIFAMRAAPVQVNFLGYPATLGAGYIDYILADDTIIPASHREHYAEKIAYLPSYQPNDATRMVSKREFTREESGLPPTGFVFCCFNNHYKITPRVFASWMRILKEVEGSVLWLSQGDANLRENLAREAELRGVVRERIIFAERKPSMSEHLARHRVADLFLDTVPYNAHTTASDALWAGLPVLTCLGSTFAGRVAASLLHAVGLPELVAGSLEEYEALALKFSGDAPLLAGLKATLARNRTTSALFDTELYRRNIEAAYAAMWERHQRGEAPETFAVPAAV